MGDGPSHYDVTEYGGEDAEAIQTAIDDCSAAGGGTVLVPPGEYETGTVFLRSHVTLRLEAGATWYASPDEDDYSAERIGPDGERVFLWARDAEDVAIEGRGAFDGRGTEIMRMDEPIQGHSGEAKANPLITSGEHDARQGEDYLDRDAGTDDWPVAKPEFRPGPMFRFEDCEDVLVRDVTMRDMPAWTIGLHDTTGAVVSGVDIRCDRRIPNNDGVAITDSRDVHVSDCTIVTCDDSIVLNGTESGGPCRDVTVTNCVLESSACAIKFGSSTHGEMRNVTFQNVVVRDSNRGLGIQHRDEGTLENVLFADVVVETRLRSGPWWGKAEPIYVTSVPRDEDTDLGTVRNVRFRNVVANGENGALIYGHEDATLENVRLEGVHLELSGSETGDLVGGNFDLQPTAVIPPIAERDVAGLHCEGAAGVEVADLTLRWADDLPDYYAHGIRCEDVSDLTVDGFDGRQAHTDSHEAAIALRDVETVSIHDCRARPGTGTFLDAGDTTDERRFADNDLVDADRAFARDATGFATIGNVPDCSGP